MQGRNSALQLFESIARGLWDGMPIVLMLVLWQRRDEGQGKSVDGPALDVCPTTPTLSRRPKWRGRSWPATLTSLESSHYGGPN